GFKTTKRRKKVVAAIRLPFRSERQWLPDVDGSPQNWMFESGRHYSGYLHSFSIKLNLTSHNTWVASKTARPKPIGQNNDVIGAGLEFFRSKYASVCRRYSQERKEIGGRCEAKQTFGCLTMFGEVATDEVIRGHLLKDRILIVLVKKIRCR